MRAAREFAVNQSFIKRHRVRPAAGMRRVGGDLNGVLVPVMMFFLQKRRDGRLLNKTLRRSTTEIENA